MGPPSAYGRIAAPFQAPNWWEMVYPKHIFGEGPGAFAPRRPPQTSNVPRGNERTIAVATAGSKTAKV